MADASNPRPTETRGQLYRWELESYSVDERALAAHLMCRRLREMARRKPDQFSDRINELAGRLQVLANEIRVTFGLQGQMRELDKRA